MTELLLHAVSSTGSVYVCTRWESRMTRWWETGEWEKLSYHHEKVFTIVLRGGFLFLRRSDQEGPDRDWRRVLVTYKKKTLSKIARGIAHDSSWSCFTRGDRTRSAGVMNPDTGARSRRSPPRHCEWWCCLRLFSPGTASLLCIRRSTGHPVSHINKKSGTYSRLRHYIYV